MQGQTFVQGQTLQKVKHIFPYAEKYVCVDGGYMVFFTETAYKLWVSQK